MIPSSPFRTEKDGNKIKLIGYGKKQQKAFFQSFFSECKNGGMYQLKVVEVTASELQRNYLFVCLKFASDHCGHSVDGLRATFENIMLECALDEVNDYYKPEDWIVNVVDLASGEVKKQSLVTMSKWTASMMSDFIELVHFVFKQMYPDFIFPNPKDYVCERVGRKNEVPFPDDVTVYEF